LSRACPAIAGCGRVVDTCQRASDELDPRRVGRSGREAVRAARAGGINPGYPLGRDYAGLDDALLVAVTERRTVEEIDRLAEALAP